jgi:hypothetical protein
MEEAKEEAKEMSFELSEAAINEAITHEQFMQMGFGTTICLLIVQDGYEALGSHAPVSDKITYDEAKTKARDAAMVVVRKHLESVAKFRRAVYLSDEAAKKQAAEKAAAEAAKGQDTQGQTQGPPAPAAIEDAVIVEEAPAPAPAPAPAAVATAPSPDQA